MPALLAEIGGFFAVLFLLISFIGWIINMINAQNPPPAPNRGPQRRPKARDRKVQNEIERFLQEAMGNRQAPEAEVADHEIEVVEAAPPRRPPAPRRQPRPGGAPKRGESVQPATVPSERLRPGSEMADRQLASSNLGSDLALHVEDHMRERVAQATVQHLPATIAQAVTHDLGRFAAGAPRADVRPIFASQGEMSDGTGLIEELRKPDGMRKAIVLQEILARPRALRK